MALYDFTGVYAGLDGTTWTPSKPLSPIISQETSKQQYSIFPYIKDRDTSFEKTGTAVFVDVTTTWTKEVIGLSYHAAQAMQNYTSITLPEESSSMSRNDPYVGDYKVHLTTATKHTRLVSFTEGDPADNE